MNKTSKLYAQIVQSKRLRGLIVVVCAFTVTFLIAREIFFKSLVFGDSAYVGLNSPSTLLEYTFQAWNRAVYGQSYPAPLAYLFLYLFSQLAALAQNIQVFNLLLNLSFPLSFITFFLFSKKFCKSYWLRIFGAAFYIINPITITYYNFGGFMWALVFLPLALSSFLDFLDKYSTQNLAKTALFTGLTTWAFPSIIAALSLTLIFLALSYLILAYNKRSFLKSIIPKITIFFLILIALNVSYYYSYSNSTSLSDLGTYISGDFHYAYQKMAPLNFLRFSGNVASPQVPLRYFDSYYIDEFSIINPFISIIIPLIAFASILFLTKKHRYKLSIFALIISAIFLTMLTLVITYFPLQISGALSDSPLFWTLRNPIKLQLMLAICLIPLFIFSIEKIANLGIEFFLHKRRLLAALALTLVLLGISQVYIYNSLAFNGYAGLDVSYGNPQSNHTLQEIINNSTNWYADGAYRGMILPFDHDSELHVQFTNSLLYPSRLGINSKITDELNNAIDYGSNLDFILSLSNTKYVYFNKNWKNTGFYILQPTIPEPKIIETSESQKMIKKNQIANEKVTLIILERQLRQSNLKYISSVQTDYSLFEVQSVLQHVYLSSKLVFYSNLETAEQIDKSILQSEPIFYEMQRSNDPNSETYNFSVPIKGTYNIYLNTYTNQEIQITCNIEPEDVTINKIIKPTDAEPNLLAQVELQPGAHTLTIETNGWTSLQNSFIDPSEKEANSDEETNPYLTNNIYDNFDLNMQFNADFSIPSPFGPNIYLNWINSSSNIRLLINNNGLIEIIRRTPQYNESAIISKNYNLNPPGSWNNLRIIKNNNSLITYLNGKSLFALTNNFIGGEGRIGIGPERNIFTEYNNIKINSNIISGIWLLPQEDQATPEFELKETSPNRYILEYNQTNNPLILFLGENSNSGWEATVDGQPLDTHIQANIYGNSWLINTNPGTHTVEIHYKNNNTYQSLVYADITIMLVLAIVSYLPSRLTNLARNRRKENKKAQSFLTISSLK